MKAIYACKLYRASSRKHKIRAAITNPINAELVQQLRSYLDDEYIDKSYLDDTASGLNRESTSEKSHDSNLQDDDFDSNLSTKPAQFHPNTTPDVDTTDEDTPEVDDESDSDMPDDVDSTTSVPNQAVVAQTVLNNQSHSSYKDLSNIVDEIKGMLNMQQDTSGVNRVLHKDSEIWIYYNDKINLNNVMGSVIELLNAAGYSYLEFNRLARTDNAIVFQLSLDDTNSIVQPVEGEEHGKD